MTVILPELRNYNLFPRYSSDLFTIETNVSSDSTQCVMRVTPTMTTTTHIPSVTSLLKKYLPSILESTCFNDKNIPFHKEVLQTEIGHLFEHILLEYLAKEHSLLGFGEGVYNGTTQWDWTTNPHGTFHITIHSRPQTILLNRALQQSILLLETILTSTKQSITN